MIPPAPAPRAGRAYARFFRALFRSVNTAAQSCRAVAAPRPVRWIRSRSASAYRRAPARRAPRRADGAHAPHGRARGGRPRATMPAMQENTTYLIIVGAGVVSLAALAALVNSVMSIARGFRRTPPLPEEMARDYATKRELADLRRELKDERDRVDAILSQQFDLIRELMAKTNEWQLGVERMIGRIEGKVNGK